MWDSMKSKSEGINQKQQKENAVMTYYESAKGQTITKERAIQELKKHGITETDEFFHEMGVKDKYSARKVLEWLGY